MTTAFSTKELAQVLETDPRTARRFLRSVMPEERPEKGARWAVNAGDIASLKTKFQEYSRKRDVKTDTAPIAIIKEIRQELDELEARLEAEDQTQG